MRAERHSEQGSALVLAILVSVLLTLLGISFLVMSDIENRIAQNELHDAQALYAAEAGARAVTLWFNDPVNAIQFASIASLDRTQRAADPDGPGPVGATLGTVYKDGIDFDADGTDDVFDRPYRGSIEHEFRGTEDGPDIRIDDAGAGPSRTFLWSDLSRKLFDGFPGGTLAARISRIDVYSPPHLETSPGNWTRYGVATVKVIARIYKTRSDGTEVVVGEKMVRAVLNQAPYSGAYGPIHSGKGLKMSPAVSAHWGVVTTMESAAIDPGTLPSSLPRALPGAPRTDPMWSTSFASDLGPYKTAMEELVGAGTPVVVLDPWFRFSAGGTVGGAPNSNAQPYPSPWLSWDSAQHEADVEAEEAGGPPAPPLPPCCDQSNLFQTQSLGGCPIYPYDIWKMVATAGGRNVHYFVHDTGDKFREDGQGPSRTFADITHGVEGVYFFDTADAMPPRDDNGDGALDNLTDPIVVQNRAWAFRGFLFLNAQSFQTSNITGQAVVFNAPGEPFQDANQNGTFDSGEPWIDLSYPPILDEDFVSQPERFQVVDDGGAAARDARGPDINGQASLWGILFTNGEFESTGMGRHYGSIIARGGVVKNIVGGVSPEIYWDETIATAWPPEGWELPRVVVTGWATGR